MVEQLARAVEARATAMEEERHVTAKLVRRLLDYRVVFGDAPQASRADKRRGSVGRAAAQTAFMGNVLLDVHVERVVVGNIRFAREQVNRLEHNILAHGNVEGRHSPSCVATYRDEDVARRPSARRIRRSALFGGFKRHTRSDDIGTLHVQHVVKRHGMKDRRHVVVSIITAIADAQKQVHLRRRHQFKPCALDLCRAGDGNHIDRDFKRCTLTTHLFSLVRVLSFT